MNEKKELELKVGIFALIGLSIFALTIFILGGKNTLLTTYYPLKLKLDSVQGLQNGSVVSLAGLKVGNITSIDFLEVKNTLIVNLRIDEKYRTRVHQGSSAKIKTQGALGDKYIYITPGPLANAPLKNNEYLITEKSGDIISLLTDKSSQFEKIFDVLNEMHLLLTSLNSENRTEKIMKNLVTASADLKVLTTNSQTLLNDIKKQLPTDGSMKKSFKDFSSILAKLDSGHGTMGALINDSTLHEKLKNFLGGSPRNQHLKSLIRQTIKKSEEVH